MPGRPPLTEDQKNELVQKLTPYLKAGLSVKKACVEAGLPKSTVYDYLTVDEGFSDQIGRIQQSISVKLAMTFAKQLDVISTKQAESTALSKDDIDFLKWMALNSISTKEEFGKRETIASFDPEAEIQKVKRMIEENSSTEIEHDDEPQDS